jgi:hypothetical protein
MPKEPGKGFLAGKITIPGTKTKVPAWGVVAVGAAGVAALLLMRSKTPAQDAISSYSEEEDKSSSSSSDTFNAAMAGALEDLAQRVADIETAGNQAGAAGPSTGSATGSEGYAPPPNALPDDVLSGPAYEFELIVQDAMSRVTANRTLLDQLTNKAPAPSTPSTPSTPTPPTAAKPPTTAPAKTIPEIPIATPTLSYAGAYQSSLNLASPIKPSIDDKSAKSTSGTRSYSDIARGGGK